MIKIKVKELNGLISEVIITGHSNFATLGKDIVCASVSSIVTTTINAIVRIDSDVIDYDYSDGYTNIKVLKNSDIANLFLMNMLELFKELETNYKNNIKLN